MSPCLTLRLTSRCDKKEKLEDDFQNQTNLTTASKLCYRCTYYHDHNSHNKKISANKQSHIPYYGKILVITT